MAGTEAEPPETEECVVAAEFGRAEGGRDGDGQSDCCSSGFVWDDESKLYFHPSSGFYHDPSAGWFYGSQDGLYYKFENGRYVALCNEFSEGITEHAAADGTEGQCPPSDWLEETLIDLYLSGYSNSDINPDGSSKNIKTNLLSEDQSDQLTLDKLPSCNIDGHQVEVEYSCKDEQDAEQSDALLEENWKAQYGQVVESDDERKSFLPKVDLWDWEMSTEPGKKGHPASRLTGSLVRCPSKLHPSLPVGGGLLKTAAIREVHLDLVRVASGKVYRLRSPSARYLASISTYDSSNPTKDWGFPDLYAKLQSTRSHSSSHSNISNTAIGNMSSPMLEQLPPKVEKHQNIIYRDRAAERRMLHGGFGIGLGQKSTGESIHEAGSSSEYSNPEDAASEAMSMSFGSGSYARRILESMGWKDGQALGRNSNGILKPLQAVSNKGCAGLGWNNTC